MRIVCNSIYGYKNHTQRDYRMASKLKVTSEKKEFKYKGA